MDEYLKTLPACDVASSMVGLRYHIVRLSAANQVNLATAPLSSGIVGVIQNEPALGQRATVGYEGKSFVKAGAAITAGALLMTSTSGRAITVTSGSAPANIVIGRAWSAAVADGDVIEAILFPPFRWSGAP